MFVKQQRYVVFVEIIQRPMGNLLLLRSLTFLDSTIIGNLLRFQKKNKTSGSIIEALIWCRAATHCIVGRTVRGRHSVFKYSILKLTVFTVSGQQPRIFAQRYLWVVI